MSSYGPLARWYDSLTEDVDYEGLYRYLMALLEKSGVKPEKVLDMACGTGSLTAIFAGNGAKCWGIDLSEDMIQRAQEKYSGMENAPVFFQGNMADFQVPEQVDVLVCMLDSFNYLADPMDGVNAIWCFAQALRPGGMLIFDVRPRKQLMAFDGQMFMDETEDVVCIWRTEFDEEENQCFYGMDIFVREGELWRREQEEHLEYAYRLRWLRQQLQDAGFSQIQFYGDRTMTPPTGEDERVFITARKE